MLAVKTIQQCIIQGTIASFIFINIWNTETGNRSRPWIPWWGRAFTFPFKYLSTTEDTVDGDIVRMGYLGQKLNWKRICVFFLTHCSQGKLQMSKHSM